MHCTQCSRRLGAADKFCAECGHPSSGNKAREKPPRQPLSNPAGGMAAHAALMVEKENQILWRWTFVGVLYLVRPGIIGRIIADAHPGFGMWQMIGVSYLVGFIPFGVLVLTLMDKSVSEDEYYSLPGARGGDGDHRCIHCGHCGIYVRGQYGTDRRHHICTKCKTDLFTTRG